MSYIAAHALEHFVIVHASLRRRVATGDTSLVAKVAATPARRRPLYLGYFVIVIGTALVTIGKLDGRLYAWLALFFGGLHVFYDGFVWKLRRPAPVAG